MGKTQKTAKGLEIPVPTRGEFMPNLERTAKKPLSPKRRPKKRVEQVALVAASKPRLAPLSLLPYFAFVLRAIASPSVAFYTFGAAVYRARRTVRGGRIAMRPYTSANRDACCRRSVRREQGDRRKQGDRRSPLQPRPTVARARSFTSLEGKLRASFVRKFVNQPGPPPALVWFVAKCR